MEYPRCTEYDEILQTPADFDPQDEDLRIIPHDSGSTLQLMSTHRTRTSADKAAMGSDHPTGKWTLAELIEMRHPFNHVEHALDITYTKIMDGDRLLDLWNPADIRTARSISTEKMRHRLLRYPLSGPIDDAVVVVLGHFGDELRSAIGHPAAQVVLRTLPFFEPWNISLQGDSRSESAPLPAHSHIPHADHLESTPLGLPVLLSAYQTAGVSLDNATRNRLRLASVGAVRFLAVLGVTDFPVYGLSICGPYGIPSVTWYSSEDKVHIIHAATDVPALTFFHPTGMLYRRPEHGAPKIRPYREARRPALPRLPGKDARACPRASQTIRGSQTQLLPARENARGYGVRAMDRAITDGRSRAVEPRKLAGWLERVRDAKEAIKGVQT